jgi:16S rRNA (adenine1518-N6/adenine1519-N6)-dimethyltransferase
MFRYNTDIGQNFLRDKTVAEWMVNRASIDSEDSILEIGPGSGVLTKAIMAAGCARLDAVELDTRLKAELEPLAADLRLVLHWGDAVRFDYAVFEAVPTRVIANLPYHITTPVIWRLLEVYAGSRMAYMLLMTQAEAADRLASGAGTRDSNPMSITIAATGQAAVVRKVPRSAFFPSPHVDSAVVEIKLTQSSPDRSMLPLDKTWRRLLSGSFVTRRKTLTNNWASSFHMPRDTSLAILSSHSLGEKARPEELSLDDWLALLGDKGMRRAITGGDTQNGTC